MPGPTTKLTDREKCAIFALKYGIIEDWKTAYICADNSPVEKIETLKAFPSSLSRWVNSAKVKQFSAYCSRLIADHESDARQRGKEDAEREARARMEGGESERAQGEDRPRFAVPVDYYDPKNQRTQINKIIAQAIDDPKTQLDAIKAIQQTQRDDKQAAKENKIQRFFTPITCRTCPIAEKERERMKRKAAKG